MRKILKFAAIAAGILVVLFIAAVIALTVFIDPNDYKDRIAAFVKERTGRELVIQGRIELSYFPWLGLRIGKTRLGSAPGFGKRAFARIDSADVRIKLLPLLGRRIVMDRLTLNGLYLHLRRERDGRVNWRMAPRGKAPGHKGAGGKVAAGKAGPPPAFDISGIRIHGARVIWDDRQRNQYTEIRDFSLETGRLGNGQPVDVTLSALVRERHGHKRSETRVRFSGRVAWNSATRALEMPKFRLQVLGLDIRGRLRGKDIGRDPVLEGHVTVAEFIPRELFARLRIAPPAARDPSVFGKAALKTGFRWRNQHVELSNMDLRLDDSRISGRIAMIGPRPAWRFRLAVDRLALDRYLPPAAARGRGGAQAHGGGGHHGRAARAGLFPVVMLRRLDASGELRIGHFQASGITSTDMRASLLARGGLVRIRPTSARLYGGRYRGNIRLDVRGREPYLSMNERLYSLQAKPFLTAAAGWKVLSGTADMSATLTARGNSIARLQRTLSGTVSLDVRDGRLKGIGVVHQIIRALAAFNNQPVPPLNKEETLFDRLIVRARLRNGVARVGTLRMTSALLKVEGGGSVDLPGQRLDMRAATTLRKAPEGVQLKHLDRIVGRAIEARAYGPFSALRYQVRLDRILRKQIKRKLRKKLRKKLLKKLKLRF